MEPSRTDRLAALERVYPKRPLPVAPPALTREGFLPLDVPAAAEPRFDLTTVNILLGGFVGALVCLSVPAVSFVLQVLGTIVHEFGHAAVAWLYGYPSIPAFDLTYGGGVTVHQARSVLLLGMVYAAFGMVGYVWRRNRYALAALVLVAFIHAATAATQAHQVLITMAGHGFELMFAGIFLYRAMSGWACLYRVERPMYACLGYFLVFYNMRLAYRLMVSPLHRKLYENAKGGGHWMDFSRIAEEFLHVDLGSVAAAHMAACLLTLLVAGAAFALRDTWRPALTRLRDREPAAAGVPELG